MNRRRVLLAEDHAETAARLRKLLGREFDVIAAATEIRRDNPDARIVLVTVHAEPMLVEAGLSAGALGYVDGAAMTLSGD